MKLPCHRYVILSSTTKTYIHENYWICFMRILSPEHILITFAFGEKSKGISNICTNKVLIQHFKKSEVCPFSDNQQPRLIGTLYISHLFNKHVYLLKIKFLIQQIQSQNLLSIRQHIWLQEWIHCDNVMMIPVFMSKPKLLQIHNSVKIQQCYWVICLYRA